MRLLEWGVKPALTRNNIEGIVDHEMTEANSSIHQEETEVENNCKKRTAFSSWNNWLIFFFLRWSIVLFQEEEDDEGEDFEEVLQNLDINLDVEDGEDAPAEDSKHQFGCIFFTSLLKHLFY